MQSNYITAQTDFLANKPHPKRKWEGKKNKNDPFFRRLLFRHFVIVKSWTGLICVVAIICCG